MSLPASVQQLVDAIANGRLTNAAIAPAIRDAGGRDFVLFSAIRELAAAGGGGGSGNPQAAWFTWASSGLGPGIFITDDPSLASTTSIVFAAVDGGGNSASNIFGRVPSGAALVITGADGVPIYAQINTIATDGGGNVTFSVGNMSGNAGNWSAQKYVVTIAPGPAAAAFSGITGAPADNTALAAALIANTPTWVYNTGNGTPSPSVFVSDNDSDPTAVTQIHFGDLNFFASSNANQPFSGSRLVLTSKGVSFVYNVTSLDLESSQKFNVAYASYHGGNGASTWATSDVFGVAFIPPRLTIQNVLAASSITLDAAGFLELTTLFGITNFTQLLAAFSITPATDATVTPVTSETTASGIVTALS